MPALQRKAAAEMMFCPLLFGGLAPDNIQSVDGQMRAAQYAVYISNPSPFPMTTSRIDLWIKDSSKTAHAVPEDIPRTTIPPHMVGGKAVTVKFVDDAIVLTDYVGATVECDGLR